MVANRRPGAGLGDTGFAETGTLLAGSGAGAVGDAKHEGYAEGNLKIQLTM